VLDALKGSNRRRDMTNWFKPSMPEIPKVPQIDTVKKSRDELDEFMRKRGAGSNILTSEIGLPNLGETLRKKLYSGAA